MDFDSPWKEALEVYFQAFLALFFPEIHDDIDWSRGFEFLDKELQKVTPRAARGRLYVDKLVRVWRKGGQEAWVLIHIEVQAQRDEDFARRMYRYNSRISDRYDRMVVSLAILADDDPQWRPDRHQESLWGWWLEMGWPPLKLLDFAGRVAELEASTNPFAKVVLAHLKALETRDDPTERQAWKMRVAQGLYERGLRDEDVRELLRVIDWLMELPPAAQQQFEQELEEYEEGRRMPFVTSFERRGMLKLMEDALRTKFGEEGVGLMAAIRELNDAEQYTSLNRTILLATTLDEVRKACAKAAAALRRRQKGESGKRGSSKA